MSIYSRRYERYDGPLEPESRGPLVICETELKRLYREKWVRRLFLLSWSPVLVLAMRLYVSNVLRPGDDDFQPDDVFLSLFKAEAWFVGIMMAAFGSSMIARDVQNRALTLYFTRPLTSDHYLWGKLSAAVITVMGVTFVPGMLLALAQLLMSETSAFAHFLDVTWRIAAASLLVSTMIASLILLLSSLGKSSRYVGIGWLAIFFFLHIAREILGNVLGHSDLLDLMSIQRLFVATAEFIIMRRTEALSAVIAVVCMSAFFLLALRLRLATLERAHT